MRDEIARRDLAHSEQQEALELQLSEMQEDAAAGWQSANNATVQAEKHRVGAHELAARLAELERANRALTEEVEEMCSQATKASLKEAVAEKRATMADIEAAAQIVETKKAQIEASDERCG